MTVAKKTNKCRDVNPQGTPLQAEGIRTLQTAPGLLEDRLLRQPQRDFLKIFNPPACELDIHR